jgi:hypothetical protein
MLILTSRAVDRGFEHRVGQTTDYKIDTSFFSAKHAALRSKSKYYCLGFKIMCKSGATCLPMECCFSELPLYKIMCKSGATCLPMECCFSELPLYKIMCKSGATCLPMECCFSELPLYKSN